MVQLIQEKKFSSTEMESVVGELGKHLPRCHLYQLIVANIPELGNPAHRELIEKAFQATEAAIGSEIEPLKESIFGIHGFACLKNIRLRFK